MTLFGILSFGMRELFAGALVVLGLATFGFWLWMLIDCYTEEKDPSQKVVWFLVLLLGGILGAPWYFFVRKRRRIPEPCSYN